MSCRETDTASVDTAFQYVRSSVSSRGESGTSRCLLPLPRATLSCIRWLSMSASCRAAASESRSPADVERHQERAMFQIGCALEQGVDFFDAEYGGQPAGRLPKGIMATGQGLGRVMV